MPASGSATRPTPAGAAGRRRSPPTGPATSPRNAATSSADLRAGALRGVAATEALELGIDVAGLDAVILAGWPGTTASFWQRLGRAGRAGGAAAGVLVAQEDPLDHYLVTHPDELLTPPARGRHRRRRQPLPAGPAPALRVPGVPAGRRGGGRLVRRGRARAAGRRTSRPDGCGCGAGCTTGPRDGGPAARSTCVRPAGRNVRIVDVDTGALIGDVDEARAHRQVHAGAVYLHQGRQFEVAELDLERAVALAAEAPRLAPHDPPRTDTDVRMLERLEGGGWGEVEVGLARVEVTTQVTGYEVLRLGSDEVLDRVELDLPPVELHTVAVWYAIPEAGAGRRRRRPSRDVPGSLHAAEHAAIGMLPLLALCDRWDLGGLSTALHPTRAGRPCSSTTAIRAVPAWPSVPTGGCPSTSARTRETIATCACTRGCPSCVQSPKCGNGNDPLDKAGAVRVLDLLLARAPAELVTDRSERRPGGAVARSRCHTRTARATTSQRRRHRVAATGRPDGEPSRPPRGRARRARSRRRRRGRARSGRPRRPHGSSVGAGAGVRRRVGDGPVGIAARSIGAAARGAPPAGAAPTAGVGSPAVGVGRRAVDVRPPHPPPGRAVSRETVS